MLAKWVVVLVREINGNRLGIQKSKPARICPEGWYSYGLFVVPHRLLPEMKDHRELHGKWCRIESNRGVVYRVVRFSPRLKSAETEERDCYRLAGMDRFVRQGGRCQRPN